MRRSSPQPGMPGVASKLLGVGALTSVGGAKVVYTVPTGMTTIVKRASIAEYSNISRTFWILGKLSGAVTTLVQSPLAGYETLDLDMWTVFPAGAQLLVEQSTAATLRYWISGTELTGVNLYPTVPTIFGDEPLERPAHPSVTVPEETYP